MSLVEYINNNKSNFKGREVFILSLSKEGTDCKQYTKYKDLDKDLKSREVMEVYEYENSIEIWIY